MFRVALSCLAIFLIMSTALGASENEELKNFEWNFVKEAIRTTKWNMVVSPLSAKYFLAILKETLDDASVACKELKNAIPEFKKVWFPRREMNKILKSIKENGFVFWTKLNVENKNVLDPVFTIVANDSYQVQIDGKKNLNAPPLSLTSYIDFDLKWLHPFGETFKAYWPPADGGTAYKVDYLRQEMTVSYYRSRIFNVDIYRKPYKSQNITMTLLFPRGGRQLSDILDRIDAKTLLELQSNLTEVRKVLLLPKFNFQFNTDIISVLKKLGINQIFSNNFNFPQLGGDLKIKSFVQRSLIMVDEDGSRAKAQTILQMTNNGGNTRRMRSENIFDRSFLFLIEDLASKSILFAGKVGNPNRAAE